MSKFRATLEYVYENVPAMRPAMTAVNRAVKTPTFTGWGMSNHHALPWDDEQDWAHFREAADHVRDSFEHGLKKDTAVTPGNVDTLRWRHWVAAFSARYACSFTSGPVTLVECGVGDGLTAYFACNEAAHLGREYTMHCYDVWLPGRLDAMLAALQDHAVVSTSVAVLGEPTEPPRFRLRARDSRRHLANIFAVMIGYRPYTGCAMAMRRDILASVLPIPGFVFESHDLWIALVANTHRQNVHLEAPSVARRLHDANQTPLGWRSLRAILRARWMKARCLVVALGRARSYRPRA